MWQGLYDAWKDKNFLIIAVACDTGGVAAVHEWIRPATPAQLPQELRDIMGWDDTLSRNAATPLYPCLIDEKHLVAERYNMAHLLEQLDEAFASVTEETCSGLIKKVRQVEDKYWMEDLRLDRQQ